MIDSVEVEDETEDGSQSRERAKQTPDIAQVVEHIVNDALNKQAVLVQLNHHTRRHFVDGVVRVSRGPDKLFIKREYVFLLLEEETD